MAASVSIVIRCLNEEMHIGRLLSGIAQQRGCDPDVILVDSGSSDATLSIARRFPVRILHIDPNDFSFGRSLNLGVASSAADVVVAASAHVYPQRDDWLASLVRPFEEPNVALVYGRQVGEVSSAFSEQMIFRRWFPAQSEANQRHPFCNNANAAVRRSVWESMPYDEELTGLEDMAWAKRALAAGHQISYVAEASVVHVHHQTWSQVVDRYRREAIAHRRIYQEQRMSRSEAASLAIVNAFGDLVAARRERVMLEHARDILAFRGAQFLGTYRGFRQEGTVSAELKRRFYYPAALRASTTPAPGIERDTGQAIDYQFPGRLPTERV